MVDRQVVEILQAQYVDLERIAQMSEDTAAPGLSKQHAWKRGQAPAAQDSSVPNLRTVRWTTTSCPRLRRRGKRRKPCSS